MLRQRKEIIKLMTIAIFSLSVFFRPKKIKKIIQSLVGTPHDGEEKRTHSEKSECDEMRSRFLIISHSSILAALTTSLFIVEWFFPMVQTHSFYLKRFTLSSHSAFSSPKSFYLWHLSRCWWCPLSIYYYIISHSCLGMTSSHHRRLDVSSSCLPNDPSSSFDARLFNNLKTLNNEKSPDDCWHNWDTCNYYNY